MNSNQDNELELNKLRNEMVELRKEQTRQRNELVTKKAEVANLNDLLYRSDNDCRDLRLKL
jgi:predicted  nucleic acid-binding Zn-ribbon protein